MGTTVAKRTATKVTEKPLKDVVAEIRAHLLDADRAESRCLKSRLIAGQKLLRLRTTTWVTLRL
jgi:hypothetical protein